MKKRYLILAVIFAAIGICLGAYTCAHAGNFESLQRGLVGSWEFRQDRTDGPTYYDLSAYGNDASFNDAANVLLNGGFDSDTSSWNVLNNSTLASVAGGQSGNCLQITCDGSNDPAAYQNITPVNGAVKYRLNGYVKAGTEATYILAYRTYDGDSWAATVFFDSAEATASWTSFQYEIPIPAGTVTLRILLYQDAVAGAGTTLLYDTISASFCGTPTTDSHGNSNRALTLNGSSDYFDTDLDPGTVIGTGDITIAARVKLGTSSARRTIVSLGTSASNNYVIIEMTADDYINVISREGGAGSVQITGSASLEGSYATIVFTRSGSTGTIYVNNVSIDSDTDGEFATALGPEFYIGTLFASSNYFLGDIEFVAIWNRVLSAAEIDLVSNQYFSGVSR